MSTNAIFSMVCDGPDSEWKLGDYMKQMMLAGELNDIHFKVGRQFGTAQNFSAHKLVMAARSSVFRTMFYGSLPEKCQTLLDIPDIHPEAFANLLSFMYTDTVDNLDVGNVFATLSAADKYDLPRLISVCSTFIANQLSVDNCLTMLEQALEWKTDNVVQKCLEFVDTKSSAVLLSDHFTAISPVTLRMILQRSTLTAEENAVYLAVERWAVVACARNGLESSAVNRRQMLGDALFLVRFPLLTSKQLADGPGQSGLLNEAEIGSIFMHQNASLKPTALAFPTERRTGSSSAPAPGHVSGFQPDELVFAQTGRGHWWFPAKVFASDGMHVALKWCRTGAQDYTIKSNEVVRAADILQPGQPLYVLRLDDHQPASYLKATAGGRHEVTVVHSTLFVGFSHLSLRHDQVAQWKGDNGH
ncbi:BTB/POZ domain-containing protein 6-B-like [Paramacrobiotus metropolitanus]|uniref:BTB/POZ domain-containing protein 6-B-like n=1 Tax=Paramacrobiotus metropolitanus TaxID=2943436 RepID=UPI0024460303|nr:BTB/POZ domain-containing protein 6-B-like [Paramacrobiotus metropolitanus]